MDAREWEEILSVLRSPESVGESIEDRLGFVEDREAIRHLIMRYGYLYDARLDEELLSLYTDDVVRELGGTRSEVVQGKDALRSAMLRLELPSKPGIDSRPPPADVIRSWQGRHLITGEVIRVDQDRAGAQAVAQFQMVKTTDLSGSHLRGVHEGTYVFRFVKENAEWRFARMFVITDQAHNPLYRSKPRETASGGGEDAGRSIGTQLRELP